MVEFFHLIVVIGDKKFCEDMFSRLSGCSSSGILFVIYNCFNISTFFLLSFIN